MKRVGIFPASGALGSSTYTHLVDFYPPSSITLISRSPSKTPSSIVESGVTLRTASYTDSPSSLVQAFSNIDVLFLISYPSHVHAYRTSVHIPALHAAYEAGVRHVVYSSLAFALPDEDVTKAEVMGAHLDVERELERMGRDDEGFKWTVVREGLYSESTGIYTAFFDGKSAKGDEVNEILIPHDGSAPGVSWVKRDELGEASARIIAQVASIPGDETSEYTNKMVALTGAKEYSLADTVAVLAKACGKEVKIREVSVDEYVKQPQVLDKFGTEEKARTWATAWDAIRAGETKDVLPDMRRILRREPEGFDVTVRDLMA